MNRSPFITWDQLKVGLLILLAIVILGVAAVKLGQAANLFSERYELVALLPNASGLREGGSVTVAGQLSGIIESIEFLPADGDTTQNLKVTMKVDERTREQIRSDSRVKVRTMGLLGDKTLDISPGTVPNAILDPGDTLAVEPSLDYEQVLSQAAGAVGDMVQLTADLRAITGGLVRGEGTMGQLLSNRTLYDELAGTLTRTNTLLSRLQQPGGTFGRLLDDPALYERMVRLTGALDTLMRTMASSEGTLGKLMRDDTLYTRLTSIAASADSALRLMTQGQGFAARMLNDQALYDRLNKTLTDLSAILEDVRANPGKYTKGMVKVF
jgi:phospholipid/cholesterol/gamma-HCH transport system substrate-binding protein